MPYLQLDLPRRYPVEVKRRLARQIGDLYAKIMQTKPENVTVAFRELGEGSIWRCGTGEPVAAAAIACDIRRGRSAERRAQLAEAFVSACVHVLELADVQLTVGFTQHAGDEAFRPGHGLYSDWTPAEGEIIR